MAHIYNSKSDETEFKFKTNETFNEVNKWFHNNLLMLKYNKTYFLTFLTKSDKQLIGIIFW